MTTIETFITALDSIKRESIQRHLEFDLWTRNSPNILRPREIAYVHPPRMLPEYSETRPNDAISVSAVEQGSEQLK